MQDRTPPLVRSFQATSFDAASLVGAKAGNRISLCLPARNEAATVGAIVRAVRRSLVDSIGLIDEVLVVDDHSSDATADVAAAAGARVIRASDVLASHGKGPGKGRAMWKSLHEADGDLIVWCDADIVDFDHQFVVGLLGPLLTHPELQFAKGFYERPVRGAVGGGRVTELVARPLLSMYFPALAAVVQPLAGELAMRRSLAERLPFISGYGVDVGLLIDSVQARGVGALAQVDLGLRRHRNRTLDELGPQAFAVMQTILRRAGVAPSDTATLMRPGVAPLTVSAIEQPPMVELDTYRAAV